MSDLWMFLTFYEWEKNEGSLRRMLTANFLMKICWYKIDEGQRFSLRTNSIVITESIDNPQVKVAPNIPNVSLSKPA